MTDAFRLVRRTDTAATHDHEAAQQRLADRSLPKTLHNLAETAPTFRLDQPLETAINMALAVGAPLLLTGEPGTGKTQVAWYLGWYFNVPVYVYQVRSAATADDMKYDFDAVAYLRHAQREDDATLARHHERFMRKKALWQAYECDTDCVLLIDEIDKAPRDFPNDLLLELDQHWFQHPFLDERVIARRTPITVITSNVERRLPDAFLRRCIFHHIELTEQLVQEAVNARAADFANLDAETRAEAQKRFWDIRSNDQIQKLPSTAEILIWLTILSAQGTTAAQLRDVRLADLPAITALIKDRGDFERLGRQR
ncbi:MAG: hypothetical protein ETSY1_26125 [Candidatus Entotheonella factor]|uniref:AAA+ ATPase domain-containing protein n=1 Tax=Entotheonella factor TaxID=1429438 RepID=W4LEM7_ENTF1|nr:MAG: hypothetical protein ETSY1_26125 [Candidatus Entotheonella factor]